MADLRLQLWGVELADPRLASSGPLCYAAKGNSRGLKSGAAGEVTRTIALLPAENPDPHILAVGRGNKSYAERWTDLSVEQWIEEEFPVLRDPGGVVFGSQGHKPIAVEKLTPMLAEIGLVRLLEITSYSAEDVGINWLKRARVTE